MDSYRKQQQEEQKKKPASSSTDSDVSTCSTLGARGLAGWLAGSAAGRVSRRAADAIKTRPSTKQTNSKHKHKKQSDNGPHVVESLLLDDGVHFTEDDTPCSTDCVLEVFTERELDGIFSSSLPDALVVVDFFKTDCPACKYMAPGFHRLCRAGSRQGRRVVFAKHNVYNEDGELTPLARRYQIKSVPQFRFFTDRGATTAESFATRDRERLKAAVEKWAPGEGPWDDAAGDDE